MHYPATYLLLLAGPALTAWAEVPSSIRPLTEPSALVRGVGIQSGVNAGEQLVTGTDYSAVIGPAGLEITPFLGSRAPQRQSLSLAFSGMERGGRALSAGVLPAGLTTDGLLLSRELGQGVLERFEATEAGIELSYLFPHKPAGQGDLIVHLALASTFGEPSLSGSAGLEFSLPEVGGVRIGAVTGIDAEGQTTAGRLVYQDGVLDLVLPAAFVESAAYPLVLDPLVGSFILVAGDSIFGTNEDLRPDLAYDASTDQYLIAWERAVSASESRIFARRLSGSGTFNSSPVQLSQTSATFRDCHNVAVANVNLPSKFVVVWEMQESTLFGSFSSIQYLTLDANFSLFGTHSSVFSSNGGDQLSPDVSGEGVKDDLDDLADFMVVWDDNANGRLAYRHFGFNIVGALDTTSPAQTLISDSSLAFTTYSEPSIARASGFYNKAVIAYRRFAALGPVTSIRGHVATLDGTINGSSFLIHQPTEGSVGAPDLDGFDRQFVCAFETTNAAGQLAVQAAPIALNVSTNVASIGAVTSVTNFSSLSNASRPAVGFSQGKSWIGWRNSSLLGNDSVQIKGYDSATCTFCEGSFVLASSTSSTDLWVAIATPTSGGDYPDDRGCAVFSSQDSSGSADLSAQLLKNNSQGGSYQNLGGACGDAGSVGFNGNPSIGSSWWYTYLTGLPVTTLAAFYNITTAAPSMAVPCGACLWLPFEISGTSAVQFEPSGGTASSVAIIPCKPNLVGAQVTVQWTTFNPLTSPCPSYPSLSISDRWRVTIGN